MKVNDVVQFNENHKWCGCLGIISEIKDCGPNGIRYQVALDIPMQGIAYIFVMDKEKSLELIGPAVLILKKGED